MSIWRKSRWRAAAHGWMLFTGYSPENFIFKHFNYVFLLWFPLLGYRLSWLGFGQLDKKPEVSGKKELYLLTSFLQISCWQVCSVLPWLMVGVGGPIPQQGLGTLLGKRSWAVQESRLSNPRGANQQAALLHGPCLNPYLDFLPDFLQRWTVM